MIEVVEPGLHTTVQATGRPGWAHLGVPPGGPADPWSLAVANVLAGNPLDAAALEVTVQGPRLRALVDLPVALAGAELGAIAGGEPLPPGRARVLAAGSELSLPGPPRGAGSRAYVAFGGGGIDVPVVLGSRSTCLAGGFGGLDGRPLRAGDRLRIVGPPASARDPWPGEAMAPTRMDPDGATVLRILAGPAPGADTLTDEEWTVATASDRMGLRLEGGGRPAASSVAALPSHGVVRGAVQVPPDGLPILLGADHQPTGGYPVPAVVISADLAAAGQLRAGDRLRFALVDRPAARAALLAQRNAWDAALRMLERDAAWDDLWQSAGS